MRRFDQSLSMTAHSAASRAAAPEHSVEIVIDGPVSAACFARIADGRARVALAPEIDRKIAAARLRLARCVDEQRLVYGVTTGFGPLANHWIETRRIAELQRNLIYHLATGVGSALPYAEARGLMLARLLSMTQGFSGAAPELVALMIACLNAGLAPVVPEKGTVGASGDLTPCAHMALALMGEGAFFTRDGRRIESATALAEIGAAPYRLDNRDGLALVNGVSAMAAIAARSHVRAVRALENAFRLTAIHAEIFGARAEAWAPDFGAARPHAGQIAAHERLNALIALAPRIDFSRAAMRRLDRRDFGPQGVSARPVAHQDPYTLRCAPQILGACHDMIAFHGGIVEVEINAATDNPIFTEDEPLALHGGNFYGQHIAFASDALAPAAIKLAVLSERQLARLVDPALNHGLPAFLQPNLTGLHSGFMGAQVTASALLAEMRAGAIPASIQSIPTNGNNQDVVSMGTIAARKTRNLLDDLFRVQAIQAMACVQAVDLVMRDSAAEGFSPAALKFYARIRRASPFLAADRPLSGEIEALACDLSEERW